MKPKILLHCGRSGFWSFQLFLRSLCGETLDPRHENAIFPVQSCPVGFKRSESVELVSRARTPSMRAIRQVWGLKPTRNALKWFQSFWATPRGAGESLTPVCKITFSQLKLIGIGSNSQKLWNSLVLQVHNVWAWSDNFEAVSEGKISFPRLGFQKASVWQT